MRSEVYEIDGVRIFTLGGAASIDRAFRIPFATWWPQEIPTERNFDEARANLSARDWEVDYVVTRAPQIHPRQHAFPRHADSGP